MAQTTSASPPPSSGQAGGASHKWVYLFDEPSPDSRNLLGGKGAGCASMTQAGLPVPPGFTITTESCVYYYSHDNDFPDGLWDQTLQALAKPVAAAAEPVVESPDVPTEPDLRGLIISDFTADVLAHSLGREMGFPVLACEVAPFGQVIQTLMQAGMTGEANPPDFAVVWTRPEAVVPSFQEITEFRAVDRESGKVLWSRKLGSGIVGNPITYKVKDKQYVSVYAGIGGWVGLPVAAGLDLNDKFGAIGATAIAKASALNLIPQGGTLYTFRLSSD